MLTIRAEQIAAFEESMRPGYHDRLLAYFKEVLPEYVTRYQGPALRELIVESEQRARAHGLKTSAGVARFIGLSIIIGPRFDDEPKTKLFLQVPELDADRKMELLCRLLARKLETADVPRP